MSRIESHLKNGRLHRLDGPAYIRYDSNDQIIQEEYYIDGLFFLNKLTYEIGLKNREGKVYTQTS